MNQEKKICLEDKELTFVLRKNRRSKRVRLHLYHDNRISVTMPFYLSYSQVEKFLREKASWILKKIEALKKRGESRFALGWDKNEYARLKKIALGLAIRKVEEYNRIYNFSVKRISIRNQKTRWGSCSAKGNLNFNYQIVKLPEKYADYLIVHELCHLKEFNHSARFWNLVGKTIPNWKTIRKEMKLL